MKTNRMKDALENIAHRGVPENTNLWSRIESRINKRNSFVQTMRARPVMVIVFVVFALSLLTGVVYAIGNLMGYIPGVGLVDQNIPVRILTTSVTDERDGLSVNVERVVADADRTSITYGVIGVPIRDAGPFLCEETPFLQLSDGSILKAQDGRSGGIGGKVGTTVDYTDDIHFAPVPADENNLTLVFPCIMPRGTGPEDWQIHFTLSPAPKDYATPAVEIGATFVSSNPKFVISPTATPDMRIFTPEPLASLPPTPTPVPNGSGLYLEKVIELPKSYVLVGNFTDTGDLPGSLIIDTDPNADLPHMEDSAGNLVTFKVRADIRDVVGPAGARYWAFEISKSVQWPMKITMDQINISNSYTHEFTVDVGNNPQTGQKWQLDLPIQLGEHEYVMDSLEAIGNGYLLRYHSGRDIPEGTSPMFDIIGHTPEQDSSAINTGDTTVEYSEKLVYSPPLPTGQLTIDITDMKSSQLYGPWTLTWSPPSK